MLTLSPAERRDLRARAHRLHPVVSVGRDGLTAPVLHEIDVNLLAHELVKVRVFNTDRDAREIVLARICTELEAAAVQHIGKLRQRKVLDDCMDFAVQPVAALARGTRNTEDRRCLIGQECNRIVEGVSRKCGHDRISDFTGHIRSPRPL